ncbi:MAG: response regulator [Acidobacteria bacterium]|nr:response regulator [Acidobacteriota bacterium]
MEEGYVILLVEDEEVVRRLIRKLLEMQGYRVIEAATGWEALRFCEGAVEPIHLVVTDVMMPGMSGPELAMRLKRLIANVPVIYISGYSGDKFAEQGLEENDIVLVEKPFNISTLVQQVKKALALHH